ncbi:hybrid sensor histidine kinase/response regulator [Stenomitos frigidus ULC18]|uniref:histidine kinase n=2 Tax=Stenomitos TaxID=1844270 RepID=A0A2T1DZ31_9CYAN|nr:hybrid sensor histidine kinase/response regulator [Stenomitos frigidus ULC18]
MIPERTAPTTIQIMVVEDESVIAADIKDCLENLGYGVLAVVASGEEAVATATSLLPDLVLMDIRLKGVMDGIQAAAKIWQRLHIPVVYSTGHSDRGTMERAKATGPFGYVLKPVEEQEMYVAIETALQRFRLDQALQKREQWLSSILRSIGDGIIVVDADCRVRFLNLIAEALTGWKQDDALNKTITDVFHIIHEETQTSAHNVVSEALQSGTLVYPAGDFILVSQSAENTPIMTSIAPFLDDNNVITGAVIVFRDDTERRQAEERNIAIARSLQLESQMAELQSLNQQKDDFLNTVSHELRTPLTNIKMAIRMLELTLDQRDSSAVVSDADSNPTIRYLKILSDQCDRQTSLINDLLDLQRLNANAYTIDLSTVHLQRFLPEIVENFQARAKAQQQALQINVAPDLPSVMTDATGLSRIITELVNNAIKYTPADERITVTVQLLEQTPPSTTPIVQFQIANSGVEIPPTALPLIFDQFYRVPSADRWRQGGTGLGLTLIKKLVNHLGGSIHVTSKQGQTCFTVELPVDLSRSSVTAD